LPDKVERIRPSLPKCSPFLAQDNRAMPQLLVHFAGVGHRLCDFTPQQLALLIPG
jgi:hypothetical protein